MTLRYQRKLLLYGGLRAGKTQLARELHRVYTKGESMAVNQAETKAVSSEPYHDVRLPASTIRRMAKLSPDADRKLRIQVPEAFSEVVRFRQGDGRIIVLGATGGREATVDVVTMGPQAGVGLYLTPGYEWAIEPYALQYNALGAQVLVARRKF